MTREHFRPKPSGNQPQPLVYTLQEAAKLSKVCERTMYNRAKKGLVPNATKVGRLWRFPVEPFHKYLGISN